MKKVLKKFWADLTTVAKIFFIASVMMAPFVFFSGFELNIENRSGAFPNSGIGLGYNEHIEVDNVELAFITTSNPHYIIIRYIPNFLNETRSNYVLFELPYDGKIQESYEDFKSELADGLYERWKAYSGNDVTILYKIYHCDKENPCKRPYNGNEEIRFVLNEKIDSKSGDSHTVQLRVYNGLRNEVIDFLYDNLRSKEDRNPIYGFYLVDSSKIKLIVDEKIILEQSMPIPTLDYYSTYEENRNKFYEWDFSSQIAIEVNYKIPSDNSLRNYFGLFAAIELFLIGPFVGLFVQYRHKHPTITQEITLEDSRPIFELKFDYRKGEHPKFQKKDDTHVRRFSGRLYNKGGTANKIDFHYNYQEERPKNLQEILENRNFFREKDFGQDFGGMTSNSSMLLTSPKFEWFSAKKLWFVLWIDYEYLNGTKEEFIIDLNINGESVSESTVRYHTHAAITAQNNS